MSTTTPTAAAEAAHLFDRVLVGVEDSPASVEAARQAAVLTEHYGELTVLGVYPPLAPVVYSTPEEVDPEERRRSEQAVASAHASIERLVPAATKVTRGFAWQKLIEEAEHEGDTLIVLGSHGLGRIEGMLAASTATEVIHKSPCSVLLARPAGDLFPQRVVVGLDGSSESSRAYAVARRVAARFGSTLWPVVACDGAGVDLEAVRLLTGGRHEELPGEPLQALVAASADADLLVVGSRCLRGWKALGSVSERVAHRAHCSTLIVRGARGAGGGRAARAA